MQSLYPVYAVRSRRLQEYLILQALLQAIVFAHLMSHHQCVPSYWITTHFIQFCYVNLWNLAINLFTYGTEFKTMILIIYSNYSVIYNFKEYTQEYAVKTSEIIVK